MRNLLIAVGFILNLQASASEPQEFKCEPEVNVATPHIKGVPKRWTSWNITNTGKNNVKAFKSVAIFEGHPAKNVHLAPDNKDSKDNFWEWTFIPVGEKRKDPIWLACEYEDTTAVLARSLPMKVQKCRVDFKIENAIRKYGSVFCE
jgi:hypothetical protein